MKPEEVKKYQEDHLKKGLIEELEIENDLIMTNAKEKIKRNKKKIKELKK